MAARQYKSTADSKTIAGAGITSAGQTAITLSSITNLPPLAGSQTFTLVIGPDTATEEIVTVTSYGSGNVVNVTRGSDGTTAQSAHPVGTIIRHMITARDLQEPQDHIAASASVHGVTGSVIGTSDSQELTNKTLGNSNNIKAGSTLTNNGTISGGTIVASSVPASGITGATLASGVTASSLTSFGSSATLTSPNINGATINAASTIGGVSGTTLADNQTAWTAWTPTLSWTLAGSTNSSEYKQIGKTVYFNLFIISSGTVTVSGTFTFTLPVQPTFGGHVYGNWQVASSNYPIVASFNPVNTTATVSVPTATSVTANTALSSLALTSSIIPLGTITTAANRSINITGFYEVA
jgi:hypothetical protein